MERTETPLILFGHTHVQRKIEYQGRIALNPGSVGIPLYSSGMTQYMILHGENGCWREEFISLPYDTDRVIREMHEADMYRHAPYWSRITEKILQEGSPFDKFHIGTELPTSFQMQNPRPGK